MIDNKINMQDKEIIAFDLDGTLAVSKSPLDEEIAILVSRLLENKKVVVVSGGAFSQFESQFLMSLPIGINVENLIIMPTSGTEMLLYKDGKWEEEYSESLTKEEKEKIIGAINASLDETGFNDPDTVYGPPIIEDRKNQITFSALGQSASVDTKKNWDEGKEKKEVIAKTIREKIPEFAVGIGGMTSIDITRHGVDKGYAINKLVEYFKIPISKILFVGDALFEGGNDYPASTTGVDCIAVKDPEETKKLIASWLE